MKLNLNEIMDKLSTCTAEELDEIINDAYELLSKMITLSGNDIETVTKIIDGVKDEIKNRG